MTAEELPTAVRRAMDVALSALDAAGDGILGLPERRGLRSVMGPWTPPDQPGGPDTGLLRRAALQVGCAERGLPAWDRAFPGDRRPEELVLRVLPTIRGELEWAEVNAGALSLREDVDPLGAQGDADPAILSAYLAGLAAIYSLWYGWDGDLDPEMYPPDTADTSLDSPRVEFLAASALAADDDDAMRVFWRWYVTEAFPAAYLSAS